MLQAWSFLLVVVGLGLFPELFTWWRYGLAGMPAIDRMGENDFLHHMTGVFRQHGYRVDGTVLTGGLILSGRGERVAVQVKHAHEDIAARAVAEATAACRECRCDRGMVVSNQEFTAGAREAAQAAGVQLCGRRRLAELVLSAERLGRGLAPSK